jgi:hypothetical protein
VLTLGRRASLFSALANVYKCFKFVVLDADPLHVPRVVVPTSTQRHDMIDVETRAGPAVLGGSWAGVDGPERPHLGAISRVRP